MICDRNIHKIESSMINFVLYYFFVCLFYRMQWQLEMCVVHSTRKENERETVSITNKFHSVATVRRSSGFLAI